MLKNLAGVKSLTLLLAMSFSVQVYATGLMSCDAGPRETWGTKAELRAKLTAEGWLVRKIKVDAGCYEVYGTSPAQQRVEAYFDPVNFEKLLVGRRGEILFRRSSE